MYTDFLKQINSIYECFREQFTEDNVDLRNVVTEDEYTSLITSNKVHAQNTTGAIILVHWPEVEICNEYGQKHTIRDLFAQVELNLFGNWLDLMFNRTTYTQDEINADYLHSHVCGISEDLRFLPCCMGTGPIKSTSDTLSKAFDLNLWHLFCLELNLYVQTESITGIPYRKLNDIGRYGSDHGRVVLDFNQIGLAPAGGLQGADSGVLMNSLVMNKFIKWLADKKPKYILPSIISSDIGVRLKFDPRIDTIKLSNDFIKFVQQEKIEIDVNDYLISVLLNTNKTAFIKQDDDLFNKLSSCVGRTVLTFKNNEIPLQIIQNTNTKQGYRILNSAGIYAVLCFFIHLYNMPLNFTSYGEEDNTLANQKFSII